MSRDPQRSKSILLVLVIGLFIVGYAFNRSYALIEGPVVEVSFPQPGQTVTEAVIPVVGTAKNIARITLNGRAISVNERGEFVEPLIVPVGHTVMTIAAEDRFGKRRELEFPLYRAKNAVATTTSQ